MKPAERGVLVGMVVAVALGLRLWYVAESTVDRPLRADAGQYVQYAANLQVHGTYSLSTAVPPPPDAVRSPGYPGFLWACRTALPGPWYDSVRIVQCVLGGLLALITWWLAATALPFGAALAATAWVAVSPHLIAASGYVLTEALTATLLGLACALFARSLQRPRPAALAGAGLVFGITALVNEVLAPLPLLLAWLLRHHLCRGGAIAFGLAATLPIAAWQLRNTTVDLAATSSTRAFATLSHGSYPDLFFATETHRNEPYREDPEQPAFGSSLQDFCRVMQHRIAEAPWTYLRWYLLDKPRWLWRWDIAQGPGDVYVYPVAGSILHEHPVLRTVTGAQRVLHPVFVLLCLVGATLALRQRRQSPASAALFAIAVPLAWCTAVYTLFLPDARYLVPLRPLQAVLAAAAACAIVRSVGDRWRRGTEPVTGSAGSTRGS